MSADQCCGICEYFIPDKDVRIDPTSAMANRAKVEKVSDIESGRSGGSTPPHYGKCTAKYTHLITGQYFHFDRGKMSDMQCDLDIGNGEVAFTEK
ncbi:MAG: hypothetical protein AAB893_00500 [Patescibacteria group bacterium]